MDVGATRPEPGGDVDALLEDVLAHPSPAQAGALDAVCLQHPEHAETVRRRYAVLARAGMLADEDDLGPRQFGDFTLLQRIGAGGMGVVWRAREESLGREVALKLVRPELAWFEHSHARFRREAETIARLDHPGILPIHAVGEAHGVVFLVMPLVRGCSLAELLRGLHGRDPERLAMADVAAVLAAEAKVDPVRAPGWCAGPWPRACVELVLQVAQALTHAHARGTVHRDVKPSNVMLTDDGRVLLVDFGLASTEQGRALTRPGTVIGSFGYASPEQLQGQSVDARTDVFALGVVLYELLALSAPFAADSTKETVQRVLTAEPPPVHRRNRAVGADLAAIVQRAIEKDAASRYPTMAALAADLRAWLDGGAVSVRPDSPARRITRWVRREPLRALTVALAVVAALTAAGWGGSWLATRDALRVGRDQQRRDAVQARLLTGFLELAWGRTDAARAAFGDALALDSTCSAATIGLQLLDDRGAAPAVAVADAPAGALFHRAQWLLVHGRYRDQAAVREATALAERAVQRASVAQPWFHYTWLQAAGDAKDREAVDTAAESARLLWPESAFTHFWIGTALLGHDAERAAASLHRALQLDPTLTKARAQLGAVQLLLGRPGEAAANLGAAVANEPGNAKAWIDLGVARERLRDHAGALAALRSAVAAAPALPGAHYNLGRLLEAQADTDGAMAAYEQTLQLEPDYPEALHNLGLLLAEHGRQEDARARLRHLVAIAPEDPDAHRCLAFACGKCEDAAGALDAYRELVRLAPDDEEAHESLLRLLEHQGDQVGMRAEQARWQERRAGGARR